MTDWSRTFQRDARRKLDPASAPTYRLSLEETGFPVIIAGQLIDDERDNASVAWGVSPAVLGEFSQALWREERFDAEILAVAVTSDGTATGTFHVALHIAEGVVGSLTPNTESTREQVGRVYTFSQAAPSPGFIVDVKMPGYLPLPFVMPAGMRLQAGVAGGVRNFRLDLAVWARRA